MKHLKTYENNTQEQTYTADFIINIGMFIDSIRKTWHNPNDFGIKMGSASFSMFIKGKYFHGKNIFSCKLSYFDKHHFWFNGDNDYFEGGDNIQQPDCVRYINLKIAQEIGDITEDKLKSLSELRFSMDEIDTYLESEKYNL